MEKITVQDATVINMIPYSNSKVLGPYDRPDGRQHVVVCYQDGTKSTVSYPKYLLELKLGRYLEITEVCHHIDENKDNNDPDNLEAKLRSNHSSGHQSKYKEDAEYPCLKCGDILLLTVKQQHTLVGNRNQGKNGPYCNECRPVNQHS